MKELHFCVFILCNVSDKWNYGHLDTVDIFGNDRFHTNATKNFFKNLVQTL